MEETTAEKDDICGICLDKLTKPIRLPCSHEFCTNCLDEWRPKYGDKKYQGDKRKKLCPVCRAKIPPTKEMMAQLMSFRNTVKILREKGDVFDKDFKLSQAWLLELEEDFGDWKGEVLDYGNEGSEKTEQLPNDVCMAIGRGDLQTAIDWIGSPADRKRLNAGWKDNNDMTMLSVAMMMHNLEFMSILLQLGIDVHHRNANGSTALFHAAGQPEHYEKARLLLEWGADYTIPPAAIMTEEKGLSDKELFIRTLVGIDTKLTPLISSEFGGRRCEIVNLVNHPQLNGRTCVVDEYLTNKDRYQVVLEGSKDTVLISPANLKRRDRTLTDCGYYIILRKGRIQRKNFATKEECKAYVESLHVNQTADQMVGLNISKKNKGKRGKKKGKRK